PNNARALLLDQIQCCVNCVSAQSNLVHTLAMPLEEPAECAGLCRRTHQLQARPRVVSELNPSEPEPSERLFDFTPPFEAESFVSIDRSFEVMHRDRDTPDAVVGHCV